MTAPVRILHLYAGNLFGGVETLLVTLARSRDHCPEVSPEFALCFPGRLRDELLAVGVPVHDLGPVRISRPWTIVRARSRVKQILRTGKFDLSVTHSSWPHAVLGPGVRAAGTRLVAAVHDTLRPGDWLNRWAGRTQPDLAIANSQYTSGPAAQVFYKAPIRVVNYPVAPLPPLDRSTVRRELRAALGTGPATVVILQVSRLERWKGASAHVAALCQMKDLPGWEAWFAGGPQKPGEAEYLAELQADVARGGIADRVRFIGQRSDVPQLMAAADIFCQPNTGPEAFGIVFIEALYAGLPVIATSAGGPKEIVDGTCGVLVPPADIPALAAVLAELVKDSSRRQTLGAAGPIRASSLCDLGRQIKRFAEAAIDDGRSRSHTNSK